MPLFYRWLATNIFAMRANLTGFVQVSDGLVRLRGLRQGG